MIEKEDLNEESENFYDFLGECTKNIAKKVQETLKKGIPITYVNENSEVVREHPDGTIEVIETLPKLTNIPFIPNSFEIKK